MDTNNNGNQQNGMNQNGSQQNGDASQNYQEYVRQNREQQNRQNNAPQGGMNQNGQQYQQGGPQMDWQTYSHQGGAQQNYQNYAGQGGQQQNYQNYAGQGSQQQNYQNYAGQGGQQQNYQNYAGQGGPQQNYQNNAGGMGPNGYNGYGAYGQMNNGQPFPPKKSNKKWIAIIIIAVLVAIVATAGIVIHKITVTVDDEVTIDGTKVIRGDINEGDEYKEECDDVSYSELNANPSEYAGEKLVYTGEIHVIKKGSDEKTLIVDTKASDTADIYSGDTIIFKYSGDAPIYNYARVKIYGEPTGGVEDYEDSTYDVSDIPVINAKYIEILEGSRD